MVFRCMPMLPYAPTIYMAKPLLCCIFFSNNMYVRVTTSRPPVAKTFSFVGVVMFTAEVEVEVPFTVGVKDGH